MAYSDRSDPDYFPDDFGRPVVDRAAPHTHGRTMFKRLQK